MRRVTPSLPVEVLPAANMISVGEYLASRYQPDREWLEGWLLERKLGDHSNLQGALVAWTRSRQREWNIRVLLEQRMRVAAHRFRILDVCVVWREHKIEPVFTQPPLLCIEALSKDDTLRGRQERVDDYLAFGVPNVWILDPAKLPASVCTRSDFREPGGGVLEILQSETRIPSTDLCLELD